MTNHTASIADISAPPTLRAKRLGLHAQHQAIAIMRTDCHVCRAEGLASRSQVLLSAGGRQVQAMLFQAEGELIAPGEAALSEAAWTRLGVAEGDAITVSHAPTLESLTSVRRPVTQVIGAPDDPGVRRGRETLTDWLAGVARDPSSRAYIVEKLEQGVGRIARGTWNDLLRSVPRERMVPAVTALARSEAASRVYRDAIRRALRSLLDRRVGRPGDWLSVEARNRVEGAISEPLWRWLQGQVPKVVRTLNVGRRVEEKVRGYPVERMEELVKRVTERELRLIVRLGYFLGAVIGVTLVLLTSLVG